MLVLSIKIRHSAILRASELSATKSGPLYMRRKATCRQSFKVCLVMAMSTRGLPSMRIQSLSLAGM